MRWLTFIVLTAVAVTLQSAIAPRVAVLGARPDWLLVLVVFFALHARLPDAVMGAWFIGLCADLMTIERLGLIALSYTVVAAGVGLAREYFFPRRTETQFLMTLTAGLLVRFVWTVYSRILYDPAESVLSVLAFDVFLGSVYTAVWAPPLHKVLLSRSRTFRLPRPRYTFTG